MESTTVSKKYQIVVPKAVRKKMNIVSGQKLIITVLDDERAVIMKQPKHYAEALSGLGAELWNELGGAEEYLKEERASW